ncbi:TerB family tellurite resistance protein [Wenyingzhuangia sp. 2_MG-2023]|uniref:TerB family tellurite resistance protein n=1 Tax=Wenyingzhuangia sp. 2_MG-2023 TaxID=3062639 RepID=UPI0026E2F49C|nr:TerB family tellurite resistance protein [Wenyingzhuangia sp. 2_MG-2023]MDO6737706.1 TerB family tellurite resistance protein [Wenyingzhuangia sp. 2_MG-2023]
MKKFANWLGAGIGFVAGGPIGAALGYLIGSVLKGAASDYSEFQENNTNSYTDKTTQAGDFEISLLFLSAVVIKADGKILQKELDYVRNYFVQMYGKDRANNAFKLFKGIINDTSLSTQEVCTQIRNHMTAESRAQLVHFLFSIAKADGHVADIEVETIKAIATYLYISPASFESIKAMFYENSESAYQILEISKSDDNDTIKKAYRRLVKEHHPDKLAHLGEEHMKGAQEKFQKIQEAYETVKKERGI